MIERLKTCGNCGRFESLEEMLPSGLCAAQSCKLVRAGDAACVKWEKDWRGLGPGGTGEGASKREGDRE